MAAPLAPVTAGTVLGDRYRLGRLIGRGGMGAVYEATQLDLGRRVAVKVLEGEHRAPSLEALARFRREAQAAARIQHPNIVQINDFQEASHPPFLVMEYLEGESLASLLEREGPLSGGRVAYIAWQVLSALSAAHREGLVHRDIKPDNVFLTDFASVADVVKLLDFGIAKLVGESGCTSLTSKGAVIGTPAYMAPEQVRGLDVDARTDIYAVGAFMYDALTGQPPFRGEGVYQVLYRIAEDAPAPLLARRPDLDPALAEVVQRALRKSPEDRFSSAEEMATALAPWVVPSVRNSSAPRPVRSIDPMAITLGVASGTAQTLAHLPPVPDRGIRWSRGRLAFAAALSCLLFVGALAHRSQEPRGSGREVASSNASVAPVSCVRNAECAAGGKVCSQRGVCVPRKGCATNLECTAQNAGAPSRCDKDSGQCLPLASAECTVLAEPDAVADDATLWIGVMFPETGPDAQIFGSAHARGAELARRDFMSVSGGIPVDAGGRAPRPVGIVRCDDATNAARSARHLVDDVAVPAVIGFGASKEAVDLASSLFVPRGVLTITAPNRSPMIDAVAQTPGEPRLVLRTQVSATQFAEPMAAVIEHKLEPAVRAAADGQPTRIALVRSKVDVGMSFSDALFRTLRFNGKSVLDNEEDFREVVVDEDSPAQPGAAIEQLTRMRPNIVLYMLPDLRASFLKPLEEAWPAHTPRPIYFVPDRLHGDALPFLAETEERRHRVLGILHRTATVANAQLAMHYDEVFGAKLDELAAPATSYDAFYLLAYAASTLGGSPVSGRRLAGAIARLQPSGEAIDVGPAHIFDAFKILRDGGKIDLNGAATSLDFDASTGEPTVDFDVLCLKPARGDSPPRSAVSGLRFDRARKTLEGSYRCDSREAI